MDKDPAEIPPAGPACPQRLRAGSKRIVKPSPNKSTPMKKRKVMLGVKKSVISDGALENRRTQELIAEAPKLHALRIRRFIEEEQPQEGDIEEDDLYFGVSFIFSTIRIFLLMCVRLLLIFQLVLLFLNPSRLNLAAVVPHFHHTISFFSTLSGGWKAHRTQAKRKCCWVTQLCSHWRRGCSCHRKTHPPGERESQGAAHSVNSLPWLSPGRAAPRHC